MEVDRETDDTDNSEKTWLGTSLNELYEGKGPWSFSISPVNASKYHTVLYELPATLKEPPKPHISQQQQSDDSDYVQMPHSEKNLFSTKENGQAIINLRWHIITKSLLKPIKNSNDLEAAINSYNSALPKFTALHYFFQQVLDQQETETFFQDLLPKMINLALQLPDLLPQSFPLLKSNHNRSVSLSQLQAACLLANAFLCTFPWKKGVSTCPGINFMRLFAASQRPKRKDAVMEKLKCLLHYFRRVTATCPVGVLTFERRFIHRSAMPRWDMLTNIIGRTRIHINSAGTIEDDGIGFLQVDFAHKLVGGGVLEYGCVQEEIRFVICPELIVSRMFVETLGDQEAVIVIGPERFSKYSGYGQEFKWVEDFVDETPYDEYGRRRTSVCMIDAVHFKKTKDQFYPSAMLRELNKAYVGFSSNMKGKLSPVATGNWGCGVYRGLSTLKSLLQLIACNAAERDMVYYTFGNKKLRDDLHNMYLFISRNNITITELWRILCKFSSSNVSEQKLYSFIQQAYFDSKKQPDLKKYFGDSNQEKEPSTSTKDSSGKAQPSSSTSNTNIHCSTTNFRDTKDFFSPYKEKAPPLSTSNSDTHKSDVYTEDGDLNEEPQMDCDFEKDVIEGTPPGPMTEFKFKKKTKIKTKLTEEEIIQNLPKTDIVGLMDDLEGVSKPSNEKSEPDSLLTHIDKIPRKTKLLKVDDQKLASAVGADEGMDVDFIETSTSKAPKRKISDYFSVKSKNN
ncbi:unnamed protein product [Callosobruchus maculatus]|uniref:poly(ADP-ribose) glycohydrolase n=1 Tax=Callosobruchus maculatus TaxID=64391 RepID=A0A653DJJ8_CALMS|nr:unnamed protein product [Callosobruchus maculatus]